MSNSNSIPPNSVDAYVSFERYVRLRPQFFPSNSSPDYFLRWQRPILLEAGVLISTPKGDFVKADLVDDYILTISRVGKTFRSQDLRKQLYKLIERKARDSGNAEKASIYNEIPF